MFKLIEMFDGKIILGANELSPDEITYLAEYKMELNDQIMKETEARRKQIDEEVKQQRSGNSSDGGIRGQYDKIFGYMKNRQIRPELKEIKK